jgi:hypothetical protein
MKNYKQLELKNVINGLAGCRPQPMQNSPHYWGPSFNDQPRYACK